MSTIDSKVFCLTGTLSISRAAMTAKLVGLGATVVKTVTKNCDYLLMSEDVQGTKKCDDATKKGVECITEDDLAELIGDAEEVEVKAAPKKKAAAKKAPAKKAPAKKAPAKKAAGGALAGKVFCMTGTLSISRAAMSAKLIGLGATVAKTVTNNCDYLLMSEDVQGTKKCDEANRKGAECITEDDLEELIGGEGGEAEAQEEEESESEEEEVVEVKKKPTKRKAPAAKEKKAAPPAKKAKAATGGAGATTYLVCDSSSGGKFWECVVSGETVTCRWGKVGSDGQTKSKDYASEAAAQKDADKQIAAKQKKGYE